MIPILVYGATCWDPFREEQIIALDELQQKAAKFAYLTNVSNWEVLAQCTKKARICAQYKVYSGKQARKVIGDRLQRP